MVHEDRGALILNVCNVLSKAFTLCPFVWNLPGMKIWVISILCFKMATAFSWACLCFCSVLFCWFSFFLFFCFCFFFFVSFGFVWLFFCLFVSAFDWFLQIRNFLGKKWKKSSQVNLFLEIVLFKIWETPSILFLFPPELFFLCFCSERAS